MRVYVRGGHDMNGPRYMQCVRMEMRVVSRVLKALREDDGVSKNPFTKKLVGHEEVAHTLEATWASEHER